jgi:hypothetical protein
MRPPLCSVRGSRASREPSSKTGLAGTVDELHVRFFFSSTKSTLSCLTARRRATRNAHNHPKLMDASKLLLLLVASASFLFWTGRKVLKRASWARRRLSRATTWPVTPRRQMSSDDDSFVSRLLLQRVVQPSPSSPSLFSHSPAGSETRTTDAFERSIRACHTKHNNLCCFCVANQDTDDEIQNRSIDLAFG